MNWTRIGLAIAVSWILGPGASAAPQSGGGRHPDAAELQRVENLLRERNRETLHPGNPLTIGGLEAEENDFRERSPALASVDRSRIYVDPQESRARRLAMYAGATSFNTSLKTLRNPNYVPPATSRRTEGESSDEEPRTGLAVTAGLMLVAIAVLRRRALL